MLYASSLVVRDNEDVEDQGEEDEQEDDDDGEQEEEEEEKKGGHENNEACPRVQGATIARGILQRVWAVMVPRILAKYLVPWHRYPKGLAPRKRRGGGAMYAYDTCIVVDCSQWLDVMASYTKARFPDVDIRVVHSASSLSGFCVVMKLANQHQHQHEGGGISCGEEFSSYCMVARNSDQAAGRLPSATWGGDGDCGWVRRAWKQMYSTGKGKGNQFPGVLALGCILLGTCYALRCLVATGGSQHGRGASSGGGLSGKQSYHEL